MEKEKRIEEMAKTIKEVTAVYEANCSDVCDFCPSGNCVGKLAKYLYEQGYRKQEDILHEWVDRETAYLKEIAELKKEKDKFFQKSYIYYTICKAYGIENFFDDELEIQANNGKTMKFPKFNEEEKENGKEID